MGRLPRGAIVADAVVEGSVHGGIGGVAGVEVFNKKGQCVEQTRTDANGVFRLQLTPGTWDIHVIDPGGRGSAEVTLGDGESISMQINVFSR
jgi:hypothetical protein